MEILTEAHQHPGSENDLPFDDLVLNFQMLHDLKDQADDGTGHVDVGNTIKAIFKVDKDEFFNRMTDYFLDLALSKLRDLD